MRSNGKKRASALGFATLSGSSFTVRLSTLLTTGAIAIRTQSEAEGYFKLLLGRRAEFTAVVLVEGVVGVGHVLPA